MPEEVSPKLITVSELTRAVKERLEREFSTVWIQGEVSNLRTPGSGHIYLTMKDAGAQISAVIFRSVAERLRFRLMDGLQIQVLGDVTVYEKQGQYQIIIRSVQPKGYGALQQAFEELKRKLQAEGLFEATRKRPIPKFPEHIGIVTSPTGAAIRDMLHIINRRFPNIHITIAPVRVQGTGASAEIARAIEDFNEWGQVDVIILARGGGSIEDLWSFNEEVVARALARSHIPTISAVGHEIDYTIADFVADLRAPTPSAAAELVVTNRLDLIAHICETGRLLANATKRSLERFRHRLECAKKHRLFYEPRNIVAQYQMEVDSVLERLRGLTEEKLVLRRDKVLKLRHRVELRSPWSQLKLMKQKVAHLRERAVFLSQKNLDQREQQLKHLSNKLTLLNPRGILQRGYSITLRSEDQMLIGKMDQVKSGERIRTILAEGEIRSVVE